jgi:hypothetical protein
MWVQWTAVEMDESSAGERAGQRVGWRAEKKDAMTDMKRVVRRVVYWGRWWVGKRTV